MQEEGICGTNELLCTNCLLSGLLFTVILGAFLWWICGLNLNTETNDEDEGVNESKYDGEILDNDGDGEIQDSD